MKNEMIGKVVIIRTFSAGVHVGTLVAQEGREVELRASIRVYRWRGANTLHELSQTGADEEWTRISNAVPSILLTEAIEVIPCSEAGAANLLRSRWGK